MDKKALKLKARRVVYVAIRNGKLKKKPCAVCGNRGRTEAHHPDYSLPLFVIFLCKRHHTVIHSPRKFYPLKPIKVSAIVQRMIAKKKTRNEKPTSRARVYPSTHKWLMTTSIQEGRGRTGVADLIDDMRGAYIKQKKVQ